MDTFKMQCKNAKQNAKQTAMQKRTVKTQSKTDRVNELNQGNQKHIDRFKNSFVPT